ncbi:hypothetical protein BJ138DRAFT_1159180 [Hygrophoropsis aurantiaca]|uniref:Uncharacterized protein n=1 Tax=Hygrophoropsis aurantiaca TaxID=72124 RepID=A0ACB8A3M5_9AGAM|nr:hypothetical protein BJ138DRAFT_1159180 [Hygrophoropsis aurantiaca]
MQPLILYDIPSKLPGNNWTPNPAKPRFVLSYKGLPFETVWVEYPDIAGVLKEIGADPSKNADGSETYTVPVVKDPNTGAIVTDSFEIAEYLEKTYPAKPIFPHNSNALIRIFDPTFIATSASAARLAMRRSSEILNPPSAAYFITTRSKSFGVTNWEEEMSPDGEKCDENLANLRKGYETVNGWYEKSQGKWIVGDNFSYADIIVACRILWLKRVLREGEWKEVNSWNDGKWGQLLEDVEKECNLA